MLECPRKVFITLLHAYHRQCQSTTIVAPSGLDTARLSLESIYTYDVLNLFPMVLLCWLGGGNLHWTFVSFIFFHSCPCPAHPLYLYLFLCYPSVCLGHHPYHYFLSSLTNQRIFLVQKQKSIPYHHHPCSKLP